MPFEYEEIGSFNDGLALIADEDDYGYVSTSGEIKIPLKYSLAFDFNEGIAVVKDNLNYGIINTAGNIQVAFQYKWIESFGPMGLYRAKNDSLYGLINTKGDTVLPFEYDRIGEFHDGLIMIVKGQKYGFANTNGEIQIALKYQFSEGTVVWGNFKDGFAKFAYKNLIGIMDKKGKRIFPSIFQDIALYNDSGLIAVKKRGAWGYSDQRIKLRIPYKYKSAQSFVGNTAIVLDEEGWTFIDLEAKLKVEEHYDVIETLDGVGYLIKKQNLFGILDFDLNPIVALRYKKIKFFNEFSYQLIAEDEIQYYNWKTGQLISVKK